MLKKAVKSDDWINQIQQLSLSKLEKTIVINSWKKVVNENMMYLNLRSSFYHLCSNILINNIQIELNKNIKKSIKLCIIENDDFLKKTPVEYLSFLYKMQKLELLQNFLLDPNFIMIKSFFDVELDESSIQFI